METRRTKENVTYPRRSPWLKVKALQTKPTGSKLTGADLTSKQDYLLIILSSGKSPYEVDEENKCMFLPAVDHVGKLLMLLGMQKPKTELT